MNNNQINLEPFDHKLLAQILSASPVPFYAFGSRVKHTNRRFSDLDLCYKDKIDPKILMDIQFELEDSDLPFTVDIIDYNHCSKEFQKIINKDIVLFK